MTLNSILIKLRDILAFKSDGEDIIIGDRVREIQVQTLDGPVSFYRKDGTYIMDHAGEADVGEYTKVQTAFPEYTQELQAETAEQVDTIDQLGDYIAEQAERSGDERSDEESNSDSAQEEST